MKREVMVGNFLHFYYDVLVHDIWMWQEYMSIYPSGLGIASAICVKQTPLEQPCITGKDEF